MILTSQPKLIDVHPDDLQWALLDFQDHGKVEVVNGRWVDNHGYREMMRRNAAHDRTVEMDVVSATRRANGKR